MRYENAYKFSMGTREPMVCAKDGMQLYRMDGPKGVKYICPHEVKPKIIGSVCLHPGTMWTPQGVEITTILDAVVRDIGKLGFTEVSLVKADTQAKNIHTTYFIIARGHLIRSVLTAMVNLVNGEHVIVYDYDYGYLRRYIAPYDSFTSRDDRERWEITRTHCSWTAMAFALHAIDNTIHSGNYKKHSHIIYTSTHVDDLKIYEKSDIIDRKKREMVSQISQTKSRIHDHQYVLTQLQEEIKTLYEKYEKEFHESYPKQDV